MRLPNPLTPVARWADWFEARGVYDPEAERRAFWPLHDSGWLVASWLAIIGLFLVFLVIAV